MPSRTDAPARPAYVAHAAWDALYRNAARALVNDAARAPPRRAPPRAWPRTGWDAHARCARYLRGAAELHHGHGLADHLRCIGPDDVHAQLAGGLGVAQYLHEPDRIAHGLRAAVADERKHAGAKIAVGIAQLLGGLANPGDLGPSVNHPRYRLVIDVTRLTRDVLGHHHALF